MVQCPSCNAEVDTDFGMVNCPKCDAVFMVDFDGNVHEGTEEVIEEPAEDSVEETPAFEEDENIADPMQGDDDWQNLPDVDAMDTDEKMSASEDVNTSDEIADDFDQFEALPLDEIADDSDSLEEEAPVAEELDASFEGGEQLDASEKDDYGSYDESFLDAHIDGGEIPEPDVAQPAVDPQDPLGVTQFDQSDVSQLPEGAYYYDVHITGLDTADIKREALMMLSDRRFGWNPEDIKRSIKNGELVLKNLNPVKAVIAVMNLQSLDVEISWAQKLFTDESLLEKNESVDEPMDDQETNPAIESDPEGEAEV